MSRNGRGAFLRELFLGNFLLEHVHPFPATAKERPEFTEFYDDPTIPAREGRPRGDRRDRRISAGDVVDALRKLGAFGMKIPTEYGGLGFTVTEYTTVMQMVGSYDSNVCGAALGASVDRRAAAPQAVRYRRAEEEVPAALRRRRDLGVRADRAARRLRSGEPLDHRGARRRRLGAERREALVHERYARRAARRDGARPRDQEDQRASSSRPTGPA